MEEATYIASFASKVTVVHRREEFRASQIMIDRAKANEDRVHPQRRGRGGVGRRSVNRVTLRDAQTGELDGHRRRRCSSSRSATTPTTALFKDRLDHDEAGYLVTQPGSTRTNIPGVFAAGDVQDHIYRQAVTAAGSGCMAALDAERFLAAQGQPEAAAV